MKEAVDLVFVSSDPLCMCVLDWLPCGCERKCQRGDGEEL